MLLRSTPTILLSLLLWLGFSACNTTKFLEPDEYLLKQNRIKFHTEEKIENPRSLKYELSQLYQQRKNSSFLFLPREWFYFISEEKRDSSRFNAWINRTLGEPPTIFSDSLAQVTADDMGRYLSYKGYFNADAFYDETVRKKKVSNTYHVYPGKAFVIDSVHFSSLDPKVESLLQNTREETTLQPGSRLDGQLYNQERERITKLLRNSGYANFLPNAVAPLEVDTTVRPKRAVVYLEVLPPYEDSIHQQFTVGRIDVYPDYNAGAPAAAYRDSVVGGIKFHYLAEDFFVKPNALANLIDLEEGRIYQQSDYESTNRRLGGLSIYKFVRIKQRVDSMQPDVLHFRIELTPNERLELGMDFALNYTNRSDASGIGNLIGISASPSLTNRNAFRGGEVMVTNLSAGVEVNPNLSDSIPFWNTIDLQLQTNLYFPKFIDYLGIWGGLDRLFGRVSNKPAEDRFYRTLEDKSTTRLTASYNYIDLLDFYRYNLLTASYGFDARRGNAKRYRINHLAIDYLRPVTEAAFDTILASNPFLRRSFGNQLFVSLLFRDFNYSYNSGFDRYGNSHYFGLGFETAGFEMWAGNRIYNAFALESDTLRIGDIDFSQYLKLEGDYRYYKQFSPKNTLATRINLGIVRPFGFTSDVPYVKQFYVGGPSSIRAWALRELGPGGYEDPLIDSISTSINNRLLFYQTGDLKLELNLEYRFKIFWRLNGALFLDAGNIWTVREDPGRPGSQFRFTERRRIIKENDGSTKELIEDPFYRQIAIGGGFGFRLDFTYFLLRIDLGSKLRYPFPVRGSEHIEKNYWNDFATRERRQLNFNLGLGLPF